MTAIAKGKETHGRPREVFAAILAPARGDADQS
jgi:hypothetical protein